MTFVDSFTRARESVAGHSVVADPPTHPYLQSLAQALSEIVALGEPVVGGGSGIANRLTKWTSATVVGNANVTEDGVSLSPLTSGGLTLGTRALPWGEIDLINVAALVWASGGVISQYIVGDTTSLRFARGATEQLRMTATDFAPLTTGGLTLGIATLRWGKLWGNDADLANVAMSALTATTGNFSGDLTLQVRLLFTAAVSKIVPGATSLSLRNTADNADNMLITDAGAVTFRSTVGGITTLTATTLAGTLSTAAQPNVTSVGTLTSLTVSGDITAQARIVMTTAVSKVVPGATSLSLRNTADSADNMLITDAGAVTFRSTVGGITTLTATTLAGTLSTAAQPNITSVGTLTSLTISGALTFTAAASKIVPGATSLSHRNNADSADNLLIKNAGVLGLRVLSADTSAAEGDFQYVASTLHTVGFFDDEGVRWVCKTLWIDANKTRTSTVDGSVTSKTIKANRLNVAGGRALRIRVGGVNGANSGNVNIKLGTQTLETLSMNANDPFWFEVILACSATGATGTLQQSGLTIRGGTGAFSPDSSSFTLDLTVDQLLDVRGFVNTSGTLTVRVVEVDLLMTA